MWRACFEEHPSGMLLSMTKVVHSLNSLPLHAGDLCTERLVLIHSMQDESEEAMPRRRTGQLGFMDAAVARRGNGAVEALAEIGRLVDWAAFERVLERVHASRRGEASYPPLVMFKVLLLQKWYGLSDPGMEAALSDRLSFMRFAGLSLEDRTPDHTTIWRFRQALAAEGLIDGLMGELGRQLEGAGVVLRSGTLIDASLVTSAARRPRLDEGKTSPVDPEARFGAGNDRGRFAFGYKAHVAVDQGSGLVRALVVTPANVQEVEVAPSLLEAAAGTVYGDRSYHSERLLAHLAPQGLGDGIMRRRQSGGRQAALPPEVVARNHELSLIRRAVESLFGTMKRTYRLGRMRCFTLARNRVDLILFALAFNLRRWRSLAAA
jgi:IS5 family transposase